MSPALNIAGFGTEGFQLLCDFVNFENFPGIPPEAMERLHRILIQAQGGQQSRSRVMFEQVESMLDRELAEEEVRDVYVLGWVMELLQFAIITSDDIVDKDLWRRGRWTWHNQPGVGRGAVFDSFVGAFLALSYLKKHLSKHKAYLDMIETINQEILTVQLYQSLETMVANQGPGNVPTLCSHKLRDVLLGLSGYFYLPMALVLHYLGLASQENLKKTRAITDEMAIYFQSQNDYLDLYGSRAQSGKEGRDIRANKCSWLIIEAMKRGNTEQRAILGAHYGRNNEECVAEVKRVMEDINMNAAFAAYKAKTVGEIEQQIQELDESSGLKRAAFTYYLKILVII